MLYQLSYASTGCLSEGRHPETSRRTGQSSEIITAVPDVQASAGQRFPTLSHSLPLAFEHSPLLAYLRKPN